MHHRLSLGLLSLVAMLLASTSSTALSPARPEMLAVVHGLAAHACNAETAAALDALGFEPGQIVKIGYYTNSGGADRGISHGIDAYVNIKGDQRSIVIQHRHGCAVQGAYGTIGLSLPRSL